VAAFRSKPSLPAKLSFPVEVTFYNDSKEADSYLWDFGDGQTSTEFSPVHTYTTTGDYKVTLSAFKSDICSTSAMLGTFVIKAANTLFIPNTFTPNGDGVNDEFVVSITNLTDYHIKIFNRYGKQLFQSANIFDNWRGTYNGEPLPVGTYYFVLDAQNLSGKVIKQSGPITIVR
jgi:gliding motility-associated-like protein